MNQYIHIHIQVARVPGSCTNFTHLGSLYDDDADDDDENDDEDEDDDDDDVQWRIAMEMINGDFQWRYEMEVFNLDFQWRS